MARKLTANPARATATAPVQAPVTAPVQDLPPVLAAAAVQVQAQGQAPAITGAQAPAAAAMPQAPVATVQAAQATANAGHVLVALQVRGSATGASAPRKAAGYAVGRTVQQCRAAGITAADVRWDMLRPSKQGPHANIVLAAPGTPAALAAQALYAGGLTPEQVQAHHATIAAALPALLAAQYASVKAGTYAPAAVAQAPAQAPTA